VARPVRGGLTMAAAAATAAVMGRDALAANPVTLNTSQPYVQPTSSVTNPGATANGTGTASNWSFSTSATSPVWSDGLNDNPGASATYTNASGGTTSASANDYYVTGTSGSILSLNSPYLAANTSSSSPSVATFYGNSLNLTYGLLNLNSVYDATSGSYETYSIPTLSLDNSTLAFNDYFASETKTLAGTTLTLADSNTITSKLGSYNESEIFTTNITGSGTTTFTFSGGSTRTVNIKGANNTFVGAVVLGTTSGASTFTLNTALGDVPSYTIGANWTLANTAATTIYADTTYNLSAASSVLVALGTATAGSSVNYNTAAGYLNSAGTTGQVLTSTATGTVAIGQADATALNLTSYPNLFLGAAVNSTYSGTLTTGANGYLLGGGGATLTVSPVLADQNGVPTPLTTRGNVTLTAANTFTGNVNIAGGSLNVGSTETAGTSGPLGVGGAITFAGGTLQYSAANQFDYSTRFTSAVGQPFSIDTNGQSVAFAGVLANGSSGTASTLTKLGTGTLTLNAANTYLGLTTVSAGTLVVNKRSSNTYINYTVAAGALLDMNVSSGSGYTTGTLTVTGNGAATTGLALNGGLTLDTNSGLSLVTKPTLITTYGTGSATLIGFDVNTGAFLSVSNTASGSSSFTTVNFGTGPYGYTLSTTAPNTTTFTPTGDFILNGVISGTGGATVLSSITTGFNKTGTGSLTLTGASTYSNGTAITAGAIILSGGTTNRLPATTIVDLGKTTVGGQLILNGVSQTVAGLITNGTATTNNVSGGSTVLSTLTLAPTTSVAFPGLIGGTTSNQSNIAVVMNGTGTQALSGTNTYTGGTTVTAGTLRANSPTSSLGTGAVAVNGGVLAGNGSTGTGTVTVSTGGTITAGTGAGTTDTINTLHTSAQTWAGGSYAVKLDGTTAAPAALGSGGSGTAGTTSDLLVLTGLATSGTGPYLTVNPVGFTGGTGPSGFLNGSTYSFLIAEIPAANVSSSATKFEALVNGATIAVTPTAASPTGTYALSATTDGTSGNDELFLDYTSTAPEPTSLLLAAVAAVPLALGRRRARAAAV
jgi:autotransporter-associated beta strand protein